MTVPLLPVIGVTAIGVGNLFGALVEALILSVATRRATEVAPYRPLLRPLAVSLVAGGAGWLLCMSGPSGLSIAFAAAGLTVALSLVGLWLVCREDLKDTIRLAGGTIYSAFPRPPRPSAEVPGVSPAQVDLRHAGLLPPPRSTRSRRRD